ncbi:MAG: hypothetical protein H6978_09585 [Gammaproteobacteria bacterium]|nr:hypothetical protein [Gammaproteobacteria bacterium]
MAKLRTFARRIGFVALAVTAAVLTRKIPIEQPAWQDVPLPVLGSAPVMLRVAYIENPRFASLDDDSIAAILAATATLTRNHFHTDIRFSSITRLSINDVFATIPRSAREAAEEATYRPEHGIEGRYPLIETTYNRLISDQTDEQQAMAFARPFLPAATPLTDMKSLAVALVLHQLRGLQQWRSFAAPDGKPYIDEATGFHQWSLWGAMGYGDLPWEVVITNQLIASAEYNGNSIHTALRGGVVFGSTYYNHASPLQEYSMLSTFQYQEEFSRLMALPVLKREEQVQYAAATLTHELGHLLFHFGHPYHNTACIMHPVPGFNHREHFAALEPSRCEPGSEPEMQPGAATIQFYSGWLP